MPSPFPGMDPYLEDPAIWPDFHGRFADELSDVLNDYLPEPYYARIEMRPEVGVVEERKARKIGPDVSVNHPGRQEGVASTEEPGSVAVMAPRTELSASVRIALFDEAARHRFVEIRDLRQGHALVTLIEILSPSNKRPGEDRKSYLRKQKEVLESDANLVEIDLQSVGAPIVGSPGVCDRLDGDFRYVVCVSRSWERDSGPEFQLFPFRLQDALPCVPVPLRNGEAEIVMDLQHVFRRTYDRGPYRRRRLIDYSAVPPVPLTDDERIWVRERVVAAFPGISEGDR